MLVMHKTAMATPPIVNFGLQKGGGKEKEFLQKIKMVSAGKALAPRGGHFDRERRGKRT